MGSPFRDLSPAMAERYGVRPTPRWVVALVVLAGLGFVAAIGLVTLRLIAPSVQYRVLAWNDVAADHVEVTFEVRRSEFQDVVCVVRAQDEQRIDVGYAEVTVPRGTTYEQVTYPLRTLAPAYIVEVLGCAAGGPPRVTGPQFPPGVVPPPQPWTPS